MREKGQIFLTEVHIINVEGMEKAEYSIRTHSNDCYRQDSQMNDKINE